MGTKLEKLQFLIGLKDKASQQADKMQARIQASTGKITDHFKKIGIAGAAVYAAGKSLQALVGPGVELNRALSLAGSEGADAKALRLLQNEAGKLAFQYGISANEVIKSSGGMQKAIHDLTSRELADLTRTNNLLAKAGRSSVESTTAYIGSMYGIFEAQANRMGKSRWAEQVAGQTDFVAKVFHIKSEELAASFAALGNKGVKAGIDAGEQMAVLAALQKDMGGSDAGKGYAAVLAGAANAQRRLGLSFKDSTGNMLSMPAILDKIKAKYGETLTEAQQVRLGKAFGDDSAGKTINTLLKQSGKLGKAVSDVRKVTGLAGVRERARANTDAFERWSETVGYLRSSFMQKLLPTLERWTNKATDNLAVVAKWIDKYPNVARVLGYVAIAIVSLSAALALGVAAFHLYKLSARPVIAIFKGGIGVVKGMAGAVKFLTMAMRANPIGVLVTVFLAFLFYGKEINAMLGGLWTGLKDIFSGIPVIGKPVVAFMEMLEAGWKRVTGVFTDGGWTKILQTVISTALIPLEAFLNSIGWLLDKVGIEAGKDLKNWKAADFAESLVGPGSATPPQGPVIQSLAANSSAEPLQGGVLGAVNSKTTNQSRTTNIGEQHIHLENAPPDLAEQLALMP